jgi:hypothetical protein
MNAPLQKPAPAGNHNAPLKSAPRGAQGGGAGAPPPGRNLAPGGESDLDSGKADLDDLGLPEPESDAPPSAPAPARGGSSAGGGGGGATNASTNFPPVGDIKLNKSKGTFNTYKLELSYGQIECIRQALEKDHANPIADELLQMFNYYISTVPGPGEEEDDVKARAESSAIGQKVGQEDDEMGLPMPPGQEQEQGTTVAGEGPEGAPGGADESDDLEADPRFQDAPDAEAGGHGGGGGGGGGGGAPPGFKEETDQRLPAPPRE